MARLIRTIMGGGYGGAMPPPPYTPTYTFMGHCLQEKIDTLIEESGPR